MCGGPEQLCITSGGTCEIPVTHGVASPRPIDKTEVLDIEDVNRVSELLELAASNDLKGFQEAVKDTKAQVNGVGSWYGRWNGTAHMVREQRTPAMIAALYGSVDVLKYILSTYESFVDINVKCGSDGSTALHCAVAGGSSRAVETVNLLIDSGADLNALDAQGRRPADVIATSPRLQHVNRALESVLKGDSSLCDIQGHLPSDQSIGPPFYFEAGEGKFMGIDGAADGGLSSASSGSSLSSLGGSPLSSTSPSSSPKALDMVPNKGFADGNEKVKEYFVDPSMPDIKNSLYTTDEFRMFSFKIRPCSRAYSHDWTECPFVHPGENARRRDPRRYHYSCVPCPEFRKGACRRGDACEYAHGVFECWLHPAQYRTRLCKDGTDCARRVCFFAHTNDELRPLYISSGLTMPCASPPLCPGSPSSSLMMSAFATSSAAQVNHTTPPLSPSSSPCNSLSGARSSSSVPALHLPGVNLHASRLRSSLNARDIYLEELERVAEFDGQPVSEVGSLPTHMLSAHARLNAAAAATSATRYRNLGLMVSTTNLEDIFSSSMVHDSSLMSQMDAQVQSHRSSLHMQAPMTSPGFAPMPEQFLHMQHAAALESQLSQLQACPRMHSSKQMPSHSLGSLGRMSTLSGLDMDLQNGNGVSLSPSSVAARLAFMQRDKRSHSSRDLGAGLAVSDWGSPTGKPEWGVQRDDLSKFRKSASFGFRGAEEPDLWWVQSLVKEGPMDSVKGGNVCSEDEITGGRRDGADHMALGSWMESLHLDQTVP